MAAYNGQSKDLLQALVMRILFKPDSGVLWGFHKLTCKTDPIIINTMKEDSPDDEDENEDEVDLSKTLWIVLRKNKSGNKVLK